jgi:hypothetical protein
MHLTLVDDSCGVIPRLADKRCGHQDIDLVGVLFDVEAITLLDSFGLVRVDSSLTSPTVLSG